MLRVFVRDPSFFILMDGLSLSVRLPDAWIYFLRTLVVVRRLEGLFSEEDVQPLPATTLADHKWTLVPEETTAFWPTSSSNHPSPSAFSLTLPSWQLPSTGLVLVTGPSSSGKTFLLQTLLGETQMSKGQIRRPAAVKPYSYCMYGCELDQQGRS